MNSVERAGIDENRWPGVARIPHGTFLERRAALARKAFERGCARYGVALDGNGSATMLVEDDIFYARLAESDWLGLGEAFMAGEWTSNQLPEVLARLIESGLDVGPEGSFSRSWRKLLRSRPELSNTDTGGELPTSLIDLYTESMDAAGAALFASGVRTTSRESIPNQSKGAGRGGLPAAWQVDVTYVDGPQEVSRADLDEAQLRRIDHLLDMGRVRAGSHVLEWPSAMGEVALRAAERGAGADVLAVSDDHTDVILDKIEQSGLVGPVRVLQVDRNIPSPRDFDSDYEAIINVERLETFGRPGMLRWLRSAERILVDKGTVVVQMAVATDSFDSSANRACDLVRSYIWPNLHYPTMEEFRRLVDRETGLRIAAEEYLPEHMSKTLQLQRSLFAARSREAAGLGYDRVFRRMWDYYLALQQALIDSGRLTLVQIELIHAPRRIR